MKNKVLLAVITIMILFYPIGFVHEIGHYLVGLGNGSTCEISLLLETHCSPSPQPNWLYFSLGGIFGMIASSSLLVVKRLDTWIFIGIITMLFDQLVKTTFETFIHSAYLNSPATFWYMTGLVGLFFLCMVRYYPRIKHKT